MRGLQLALVLGLYAVQVFSVEQKSYRNYQVRRIFCIDSALTADILGAESRGEVRGGGCGPARAGAG